MEPKGAKNTTIGTQTAKNFQASGSAPVSVINSLQKNPEIGMYLLVFSKKWLCNNISLHFMYEAISISKLILVYRLKLIH